MKLTYWNTSCMTYLIGMFVGLFMGELGLWWSLIPITIGAVAVSYYHHYVLDKQLEEIK